MICMGRRFDAVFTRFVEKSKYRKMISNIGQYRNIGSTKGVKANLLWEYKIRSLNGTLIKNILENLRTNC